MSAKASAKSSAAQLDVVQPIQPSELDSRTLALLQESEGRFRRLFEEIPNIPVQGYDRHRRVIFWNHASAVLYGYTAEEALGQLIEDIIIPHPLCEQVIPLIDDWIAGGAAIPPGEIQLRHKDGYLVPVFSSHVVLKNTQGQPEMYCVDLDLRDRKQAEQDLRASEEKYRGIFENITQGLFQIDAKGRYISVNPFLVNLLGYESAVALMAKVPHLKQLYVDVERYKELQKQLEGRGAVRDFESQIYRQDGSTLWVSETQAAVYAPSGDLLYYEGRLEDVTLRHQAEERLRHDAIHDKLTGLYNRTYLTQKLNQILAVETRAEQDESWAVLFVDLDRFKVINDSLGHIVGDQILCAVAQRFQSVLRLHDVLARFGGDEFVLLLHGVKKPQDAVLVATRLLASLQQPVSVEDQTFSVKASVGIAFGKSNYQAATEVLRDADLAMYQAKAEGGSCYRFFEQDMHPRALERLQLEHELKFALEHHQLQLAYQPIMDLVTGQVCGFEALLRWQHPERGWISPTTFIPIAEETGLIQPLSWWVFQAAIDQLQAWRSQLPQADKLTMNVNLSAMQLKQENLVAYLAGMLQAAQLPSDRLKLEVTETSFFEASELNMQIFQDLKQLGVGLCIDDFGTGYSSLSRLHQLPLDVLKIDRAFVDGVEHDARKQAIAQSIVMLAHGLGAKVVAEGIETPEQQKILQQLNCEFGQGYWFSRPLTVEQVGHWLNQQGFAALPS